MSKATYDLMREPARLTAAAPDLLAALKHMVLVYSITGDHIDGHPPDAECCLCEAHRAISKATTTKEGHYESAQRGELC